MFRRWLLGGLAIAMFVGTQTFGAQDQRPLAPLPSNGLKVTPFFDGWHQNPDGSVILSFGYLNWNKEQVVEIPYGPDNFIEPKEFDGVQPTSFPPVSPDEPGSNAGSTTPNPRHRQRGVFTVTVPKGFQGDVVWTLRNQGQAFTVPGRAKSPAYLLTWKMAMGSVPPLLRFQPEAPAGRGPAGIKGGPLRTTVGTPLTLTIWLTDDSVREPMPVTVKPEGARSAAAKMNATWYKYSGPGLVVFSPPREPIKNAEGKASTSVTFNEPGEYMVRVRGDNFGEIDSLSGDQCCWTNGYIPVTVTR
jgi:hypothetical protein